MTPGRRIATPVTEPMVISTRLGGMVSDIAPEAEVDAAGPHADRVRRRHAGLGVLHEGNRHGTVPARQASLPTDCSSSPQASLPKRPFHSL